MARFGVLAAYQPLTAQPKETVTKAVALLWVRRNLAHQVSKTLIRMVPIRDRRACREPAPAFAYIPAGLAPAELPGIKFVPPARPLWTKVCSLGEAQT